jgi:hypothetical protein
VFILLIQGFVDYRGFASLGLRAPRRTAESRSPPLNPSGNHHISGASSIALPHHLLSDITQGPRLPIDLKYTR